MKLLLYVKPQWKSSAFGMTNVVVDRNGRWSYDERDPEILYYRHGYDISEKPGNSSFNLERLRRYG